MPAVFILTEISVPLLRGYPGALSGFGRILQAEAEASLRRGFLLGDVHRIWTSQTLFLICPKKNSVFRLVCQM